MHFTCSYPQLPNVFPFTLGHVFSAGNSRIATQQGVLNSCEDAVKTGDNFPSVFQELESGVLPRCRPLRVVKTPYNNSYLDISPQSIQSQHFLLSSTASYNPSVVTQNLNFRIKIQNPNPQVSSSTGSFKSLSKRSCLPATPTTSPAREKEYLKGL